MTLDRSAPGRKTPASAGLGLAPLDIRKDASIFDVDGGWFRFTKSHVLLEPEVHVAAAGEKFDAEGNLTDERTRETVRALVAALVAWARGLRVDQGSARRATALL